MFTALVLVLFFLPDGLQHGLFMDGIQYAVISRNLAEGQGSFWFPFLSSTWSRGGVNAFLEHPPLFYYLESMFYRIFGDHYVTEKLFCFCNLFLSVIFIHSIWKILFRSNQSLQALSWLPVLLWFITPTVSWVFRNNLIENSLSVFILASVYFSLKALHQDNLQKWLYLLLAGTLIFCSSLIKGLPGFFSVLLPLLYCIFERKIVFSKALLQSVILIGIPSLFYLILWLYKPAARESLGFYLEQRLLNRIQNDPTVSNNFSVLFWLLSDLAPALGLLFLLYLGLKPNPSKFSSDNKKTVLIFLALALAGVLPLCLTRVQREMYYVPAIPFFAIAFAVWIAPALQEKLLTLNRKITTKAGYVIIICLCVWLMFSAFKIGGDARDHKVLEDVRAIGRIVGKENALYAPLEVYARWDLQFYLLRYHHISLSAEKEALHLPRIYNKDQVGDTLNGYRKVSFDFYTVDLFLRDSSLVKY